MTDKQPALRFEFLDGLRFLCALWVAVGHIGLPKLSAIFPGAVAPLVDTVFQPLGYFFCGTAAVMAFFIISGFLIHLPYLRGRQFEIAPFYIARLPRVALPALVVMAAGYVLPDGTHQLEAVLWSLYCEMLYYLVYPALRPMFLRFSVWRCAVIAYVASIVGIMTVIGSPDGGLSGMGVIGSTIYGLPVWILGCGLATLIAQQAPPEWATRKATAWALRTSVLLLCPTLLLLHFHSPLHYVQTMIFFSLPCGLWIYVEFCQSNGQSIYERLAGVGQATFSIYLVHKLAVAAVNLVGLPNVSVQHIAAYSLTAVLSWLFYFLVESPSHRLCRKWSMRVSASAATAVRA